jgi:hypothetical protein
LFKGSLFRHRGLLKIMNSLPFSARHPTGDRNSSGWQT